MRSVIGKEGTVYFATKHETSSFPSDGFDYSGCSAANKCWIGDGVCDDKLAYLGLNTPECNWEGGDCVFCPETSIFPRDGFDYSNCVTPNKCMIGDGFCSILSEFMFGLNTPECNWEAGDCDCYNAETPIFPNDGFDYSNCNVTNRCWLGDTECDSGDYNTSECNFDGGDCLCEQAGFPDDGFDYSNCAIENSCWIGDGFCDVFILGDDLSSFMNTTECNFDGGDCLFAPTMMPSAAPSATPSFTSSTIPSVSPSSTPLLSPSDKPSTIPSGNPSMAPSKPSGNETEDCRSSMIKIGLDRLFALLEEFYLFDFH